MRPISEDIKAGNGKGTKIDAEADDINETEADEFDETEAVTEPAIPDGSTSGSQTGSGKSPDRRDILLAVMSVIAAAAVTVAVWAVLTRDRPGSDVQDSKAHGTTIVTAPTAVPTLTDQIALPQFAWISLTANETRQTQTFSNPPQNFAQFRVSMVLDGETLWESEPIVLSRPLEPGEYEARLVYTCYTGGEDMQPLNGADSPVKLKVH